MKKNEKLEFVETLKKFYNFNKTSDMSAYIGVDPSLTCTAWSLVIFADNVKHVIFAGHIKTKETVLSKRLLDIHEYISSVVYLITTELATMGITLIGAGLEVPSYMGRGANYRKGNLVTLSRDLKQRDAVTSCRLALTRHGVYIAGDLSDKPVRPIQMQALVGASKKGVGEGLTSYKRTKLKKQMVMDWVNSNCKVWKPLKNTDQSDSVSIAIVASKIIKEDFHEKVGK